MKKLKLISMLSSVAVVATAVPVVATSCSKDDEMKINLSQIPSTLSISENPIYYTIDVTKDDKLVEIQEANVYTDNPAVMTAQWFGYEYTSNTRNVLALYPKMQGFVKLSVTVYDTSGNKAEKSIDITITPEVTKLNTIQFLKDGTIATMQTTDAIDPNVLCAQYDETKSEYFIELSDDETNNTYKVYTKDIVNVNINNAIPTTTIGDNFLCGCSKLKDSDLKLYGLKNIEEVGSNFLNGCSLLEELDLSFLTKLETIGNNFLNNDNSLKRVWLPVLESKDIPELNDGKTEQQGTSYLKDSTQLHALYCGSMELANKYKDANWGEITHTSISKTIALSDIMFIAPNYIYYYSEAEQTNKITQLKDDIPLYMFRNDDVKQENHYFNFPTVNGDDKLHVKAADIQGLYLGAASDNKINSDFLAFCTNLTYVNFEGLTEVTEINDFFMHNDAKLQRIDGLNNMTKVKRIGGDFLTGCSSVKTVDLGHMAKLELIELNFLTRCTSVTSLFIPAVVPTKTGIVRFSSGFDEGVLVGRDEHIYVYGNNSTTVNASIKLYKASEDWEQRSSIFAPFVV